MRKLLVVALLSLVASCATRRPSMEAPRRARQQYQHRQRVHERARRRRVVLVALPPLPTA